MAEPVLISNEAASASPKRYVLPANLAFIPTAITALFDGSGAGQDFLACLTFKSQSGQIIARQFPTASIADGESFEVTYAPFLDRGTAETEQGLQWAGVLGTGIHLTAPYMNEVITFSGSFQTTDQNMFTDGTPGIQILEGGTYGAAAMVDHWGAGRVATRVWIRIDGANVNNRMLKNQAVLIPTAYIGDSFQMFDIFQVQPGGTPTLNLFATSASEDYDNSNADHSLVVWRLGDYLGLSGFD